MYVMNTVTKLSTNISPLGRIVISVDNSILNKTCACLLFCIQHGLVNCLRNESTVANLITV
jgi:hypothetical protein